VNKSGSIRGPRVAWLAGAADGPRQGTANKSSTSMVQREAGAALPTLPICQ